MTAKEMFESEGYQEVHPFGIFRKTYRRLWDSWYEDEEDVKTAVEETGKLRFLYIDFSILGSQVHVGLYDVNAKLEGDTVKTELYGDAVEMARGGIYLTTGEIMAINRQFDELGWTC